MKNSFKQFFKRAIVGVMTVITSISCFSGCVSAPMDITPPSYNPTSTMVSESGDTIDAKAVHHESDATVNITFDFTDKAIGKYNGVFHFTTEDKTFANILMVEEAREITLDIDVQYPSTFLRGTSVTYTIAVTNNGNATAYDVPLELRLRSGGAFSEIESVTFTDDEGKEFNLFCSLQRSSA